MCCTLGRPGWACTQSHPHNAHQPAAAAAAETAQSVAMPPQQPKFQQLNLQPIQHLQWQCHHDHGSAIKLILVMTGNAHAQIFNSTAA
jgi:hypothetical protein